MLRARLLLLCVVASLLFACTQPTNPADEGERLWREGVWNPETVGFGPSIPYLERAVEASEGMPSQRVALLLATAYEFSGRGQESAPLMPLVRSGPPAPGPMLIDGFRAASAGRGQDAEMALSACLARITKTDPFRDELLFLALHWRGRERALVGDIDGAVADLEQALGILYAKGGPPHRELVRTLVEALRKRLDYARAEEIARDAAERDPTWARHAYDVALLCELQGREKDARFWYEESTRRDAHYPAPQLKLARLAMDAGELERAREHLDLYDEFSRAEQAATGRGRAAPVESEIAAGAGLYWMRVAEGHTAAGKDIDAQVAYGRAREALLRAAQLDRNAVRALSRLIAVGKILGEDEAALVEWQQALDASPALPEVEPGPADAQRTFR